MWFWFFSFVAFSKSYPCNISIITQVGFQANIFFLKLTIIFIQKDSYLEVSYIFAKVIPFSKSLLFSRVSPPLLRYSNDSFIKLQNTHPFSLLNIPQTAENQVFLESRQTFSIFPWTLILYWIAKVCNRFPKLGKGFIPIKSGWLNEF